MKTALFYMSLLSLVLQLTLLPASAQLTLTVNSVADGGDSLPGDGVCDDGTGACTLRAAIEEANSTAGADTVAFDIPPGGVVHTIQPLTGLPTVTDTLLVDGYTQPGALPATVSNAAALMLVLDGALVSSNTDGVVIQADFSEVAGLVIQGFEDGIKLNGSDAVIRGNYIGTDVTGQADQGNSRGIFIDAGADRTRVGGQMPEDRNLISGNGSRGITILSASNTIQGNYIGTNVDGTAALGNGIGIRIQDVRTQIGGSSEGMRNLISGNTDNGIEMVANPITGPDMFTVIQGNYIGTDVTGTAALGNAQHGIEIAGAFRNQIGGLNPGEGNVIAGNGASGILILDSNHNEVAGNLIGTDVTGTVALSNTEDGIRLEGSDDNQIGGELSGAQNLISGNGENGIRLTYSQQFASHENRIEGNQVGTDITGRQPLGNEDHGVLVEASANNNNNVGGQRRRLGNVIAFNQDDGVRVEGSSTSILIASNSIFENGALGIDLAPTNGVTPNDVDDPDLGANDLQNFPVLTAAMVDATDITLEGGLNSTPTQQFVVQFFANVACDPSGHGEGREFLRSETVMTNGAGNAVFSFKYSIPVPVGAFITATATDLSTLSTSEFSACLEVIPSTSRASSSKPAG